MREAIGGTWLFQIVIVFILLFTGFMCLSINRSKAFRVKNQIIETIESYNGIDLNKEYEEGGTGAIVDIVSYIKDNSYRTVGVSPGNEYKCFNRDGKSTNTNPVFCIEAVSASDKSGISDDYKELTNMVYYRVVVFYQLDLPVFHDLFNFRVVGATKTLYGGVEK